MNPGSGRLDFEKVRGRTVVRSVFARSPLRLLMPGNRGQAAWVYMSSFGGGLVGGDALTIGVRVRAGAQAVLLSQSSNKVYRSALEASQSIEATIESEAALAVIPDPTVCFEGAKFKQKQTYELERGASLLLVDTVHCGRQASGERWLFDRFHNQIRIQREGKPIFFESLLLEGRRKLAARIGRFNALAVAVMVGPAWQEAGQKILAGIAEQAIVPGDDLVISASPLAGEGVVLRLAGVSTEEVSRALRSCLGLLPELLGDNPWLRKW